MKKIFVLLGVTWISLSLMGCAGKKTEESEKNEKDYSVEQMKQEMIDAAEKLEPGKELYFDKGVNITGLGVTYDDRPTAFDGCYYWTAIEKMTNAHISIDWHEAEGYSSSVATTLLMDIDEMPDIVNPYSFGIMDLADEGMIVPLDEYLELMPDIVKAVGEDRMDSWR